jgi:hypothetical protein
MISRTLALGCFFLLGCVRSGFAGEPSPIFIVVPDLKTASQVARNLPGIRVGVIEYRDDETDEVVNARAVALRNATHLLYDQSNESLRMAMVRERLQMQGVLAINLRQFQSTRNNLLPPAIAPRTEQLIRLLSVNSNNND